jgi:hypothetical protein
MMMAETTPEAITITYNNNNSSNNNSNNNNNNNIEKFSCHNLNTPLAIR